MTELLLNDKKVNRLVDNISYSIKFGINYHEWSYYYLQINKANLLQSWFYAEAKTKSQNWKVERGIIYEMGRPIALIQALYKSYFFIKLVRLNQAPLWLIENPSLEQIKNVFQLIKTQWNIRTLSLLFIAPNLFNEDRFKKTLALLRFYKRSCVNLESGWIDLSTSESDLSKGLRSNWRRGLKSAERSNLTFTVSSNKEDFQWLMSQYKVYQKEKTFQGPPIELLEALYDCSMDFQSLWVAFVSRDNERIAGLLVASHGSTCSPLVSWLNPNGRELNAGNFVLWNSLLYAKNKGHLWFEQGGLNGENSSVAKFKRGIPCEEYQLIGEYFNWR